jgi:hypothetical protein
MFFATIVTNDYGNFDCESKLKLKEFFKFEPLYFDADRSNSDSASVNSFFPHSVYSLHGWASVINPTHEIIELVHASLDYSHDRALRRTSV